MKRVSVTHTETLSTRFFVEVPDDVPDEEIDNWVFEHLDAYDDAMDDLDLEDSDTEVDSVTTKYRFHYKHEFHKLQLEGYSESAPGYARPDPGWETIEYEYVETNPDSEAEQRLLDSYGLKRDQLTETISD